MQEVRHLDNAPIQEAIIDFQVLTEGQFETDVLCELQDKLSADYENFEPIIKKGVGVTFSENGVRVSQNESLVGYKAECPARNFVVQFQVSQLTVSKLRPYDSWEEFRDEARVAWNLYKEILPKYKVSRVATRFTNRLELPLGDGFGFDFDTYLTSCPKIPEGMGNVMAGFFTRIVVPRPELNADAIIIQSLEEPAGGFLPVTIDIDVYRNRALSSKDDDLWAILEGLRDVKNEAFFGSVTESALELCK